MNRLSALSGCLTLALLIFAMACEAPETPESPATAPAAETPGGFVGAVTVPPDTPQPEPTPSPTAIPEPTPVPEGVAMGDSQIMPVTRREQLLPGSWAQGDFGDWRVETSAFAAIICTDPAGGRPGIGLLDAALKDDPYDELHLLEPVFYLGEDPQAFRVTQSRAREAGDVPALVLTGASEDNEEIQFETQYRLDSNPHVLHVTTTVTNATTTTLYNAGLGDRIHWGLLVPFAEAYGVPDPNELEVTHSAWIGGSMDMNSLGLVLPEGQIEAAHAGARTHTRYGNRYRLNPGGTMTITRSLYVGGKDFSNFTDYALNYRGVPQGMITGRVMEVESDKPLADIALRVETYANSETSEGRRESAPPMPYTLTYTDANGEFYFAAPAGMRIFPRIHEMAYRGQPFALAFEAIEGQTVDIGEIRSLDRTTLSVQCFDGDTTRTLPCKVQIEHISGPRVNWGPPFKAQGFRNYYYLPQGGGTIPVPYQGTYEIVVSHGPEYSIERRPLRPAPGSQIREVFRLNRLVETPDYIAVDLGVRTDASYNGRVTPRDMVGAAVCEGVEWLVSADVNQATDLRPAIASAGLEGRIGASAGIRPMPHTHPAQAAFTVFPVDPAAVAEPFSPDYLEAEPPAGILAGLRQDFPQALLMVNTPADLVEGYFRQHGFTNATIREDDPTFNYDFDLYELLDGRSFRYALMREQFYDAMHLTGRYYTPVAASSSREFFGNEPGYPRTYVGVPGDDPAQVTEEQIVAGLRKGDVVVSNGPFIRLRCQGKGPGEVVQAHNGQLEFDVEMWAAPYVSLSMYKIEKDTQFARMGMRQPTEQPLRFPNPDNYERNPMSIDVYNDLTLQILVTGQAGPMEIISSVEGRRPVDFPVFAITGPLYVDGDGDGKYTPPPDATPRL